MRSVQATAFAHDAATGAGTVILDDGRLLSYPPEAFRAGGLRLLRPGQRVRVRLHDGPTGVEARVELVTLATLGVEHDDGPGP